MFQIVIPVVRPHIVQGTIRALAVADTKRSHFFPDVPTLAEQGITGHEVSFWMGVYAVAATPKPVLDTLHAQIIKIMTMLDVKERIVTMGFDPTSSSPDQLADLMKAETAKWSKVVRDTNIKIE